MFAHLVHGVAAGLGGDRTGARSEERTGAKSIVILRGIVGNESGGGGGRRAAPQCVRQRHCSKHKRVSRPSRALPHAAGPRSDTTLHLFNEINVDLWI